MPEITPFKQQKDFLVSESRILGAAAGKRGGKTEIGAVRGVMFQEKKPGYIPNGIDPYLGVIIAPTFSMLSNLSMPKFLAYGKPFYSPTDFKSTKMELNWHDESRVLGLSADKPHRIEGLKASWIWLDEVFQMKEQVFLECMARVADTEGYLWCTGSLGPQYVNPKQHWFYKYFKENPLQDSELYEWSTGDNPFFPRNELHRLKETLDPQTFRQMFEICWDVPSSAAVYQEFDETNLTRGYVYDPALPTYVSIDWGFAHEMACGFFQHDPKTDTVYLFDEIVSSRLTLEDLCRRIFAKKYRISAWCCDAAGNQKREQSGISNIQWFKNNKNISFKYRTTAITYGIPIVRSYIRNGMGQTKFYIDEVKCPKSVDGMKNYRYPEKDGIIQSETPEKKDDDAVDMIRYFFVNFLDDGKMKNQFTEFNRWSFHGKSA